MDLCTRLPVNLSWSVFLWAQHWSRFSVYILISARRTQWVSQVYLHKTIMYLYQTLKGTAWYWSAHGKLAKENIIFYYRIGGRDDISLKFLENICIIVKHRLRSSRKRLPANASWRHFSAKLCTQKQAQMHQRHVTSDKYSKSLRLMEFDALTVQGIRTDDGHNDSHIFHVYCIISYRIYGNNNNSINSI